MGIEKFVFGDPGLVAIQRSLDIQSFRTELIAGNLANVDTPGYQARDVDFSQVMQAEQDRLHGSLPMSTTNERHIPNQSGSDIPVMILQETQGSMRVDGNTVDQDAELQKLAEAQLLYNASINALVKKLGFINSVLSNVQV